jgi:hypothetical protein
MMIYVLYVLLVLSVFVIIYKGVFNIWLFNFNVKSRFVDKLALSIASTIIISSLLIRFCFTGIFTGIFR